MRKTITQLESSKYFKPYMKGNTNESATEWEFDFVVSAHGHLKISGTTMDEFFLKILELVEKYHLHLGGSYHPILDRDYREMSREELEEDE